MLDIVAMHIRSAPHEAQFALGGKVDGSLEMVGWNSVFAQAGGPHLISRTLSVSTLAAFEASNKACADDKPACKMPHLGDDQPRWFDLCLGNPKWPTKEALGHAMSTGPRNCNEVKYLRDHSRPSS
jgi:hypothetical protein